MNTLKSLTIFNIIKSRTFLYFFSLASTKPQSSVISELLLILVDLLAYFTIYIFFPHAKF